MRVGYVRCSTIEQNEARQLKMMEEQGAEKLFIDKASGKNTDRTAFKEMMAFVRAEDIVIVESISRIARNTRDLLSIVSDLTEKGVEFVSLKESIDTTTPQGRFMLTVFGALAELERRPSALHRWDIRLPRRISALARLRKRRSGPKNMASEFALPVRTFVRCGRPFPNPLKL